MIQLCKKLQSEFAVSLKVQMQPRILSSTLDGSGTLLQICEGDIALDSCDVFINFTDENLPLSDELQAMLGQRYTKRYEHHIKHKTLQFFGKAFCCGKSKNKVVHTILPKWIDGNSGERDLIIYAVVDSLNLAVSHNAISISLPFFSCHDDHLPPLDVLAECCLTGVHQFVRYSNCVKTLRLVLPVTMAKTFQDKFTGIFEQSALIDRQDITNISEFCDLGESAWLWEDNNGEYNYYRPEDNKLLNQAIQFFSYCSLKIGRHKYTVSFSDMIQTNTCTLRKRKVVCIPLDCIWQFKNDEGNWEQFPLQTTLIIEAMYLTGADHSLSIDGLSYSHDFEHMTQLNVCTNQKTSIRRIDSVFTCDDAAISRILISGLAENVRIVEERLRQCVKSLITHKFIE